MHLVDTYIFSSTQERALRGLGVCLCSFGSRFADQIGGDVSQREEINSRWVT